MLSLRQTDNAEANDLRDACAEATLLFTRALFRDAKTTDDKIPMMAITTKSSTNVNPLLRIKLF